MKYTKEMNPIPSLISNIRFLQSKLINEKLNECELQDLHSSYGGIIHALHKYEVMTMKDLAQQIKRDASTVTVLVRNLEKKGYVTKIENKKDTRSKLIKLTPKSQDLSDKFAVISNQVNGAMFDGFDDDEIMEVVNYLNRIIDNLNIENG